MPAQHFVVRAQHQSPFQSGLRLMFGMAAGHTIGASAAVSGLSAGRGDRLIYVGTVRRSSVNGTAPGLGAPVNHAAASVTLSGNRVAVASTNLTGRNLMVCWWQGDGAT